MRSRPTLPHILIGTLAAAAALGGVSIDRAPEPSPLDPPKRKAAPAPAAKRYDPDRIAAAEAKRARRAAKAAAIEARR